MDKERLPTDFQMRVRQRLADLRISANAASVRASLSRDAVRKMLELGAGPPRGGTLSALAAALETTEEFLLRGETSARQTEASGFSYADDDGVEIKAVAAGSYEGAFQIMDNSIGRAPLPRGLRRHSNVYAIIVLNDSMVPEHKPGDLRFVTPDIRPKLGESVVVEFERDPDRGPEAMIGHLQQNGAKVVIAKLNPPGTVEVAQNQVHRLHRLATSNEVAGS